MAYKEGHFGGGIVSDLAKGAGPKDASYAVGGKVSPRSRSFVKGEEDGGARDFKEKPNKDFLKTPNRFVGRKLDPGLATEEDWTKPKGVGQTDEDDKGDTKSLKPIKPRQ